MMGFKVKQEDITVGHVRTFVSSHQDLMRTLQDDPLQFCHHQVEIDHVIAYAQRFSDKVNNPEFSQMVDSLAALQSLFNTGTLSETEGLPLHDTLVLLLQLSKTLSTILVFLCHIVND